MKHHQRLALLLGLLALGFFTAVPAEPGPRDEVRVLIDVSGSMKQNDPANLRAPALRLLVNLLPPDSRAGVWTFAQYVNPVVPPADVSGGWRERALAASETIHSRGLFTDIGAALKAATRDWREPDPATRRSLILLTDGMVDVSKEAGANEAARREVLERLLPELRLAGVHVHTIALSANADAELLEALALATDAGFEISGSADELQRVFLRMFERSVARDTLPLEGNRFQVDASIDELTLLAFRQPDAAPARLAPPGGAEFDATSAPADVRWHQEQGYDLVTVSKPAAGEWRLIADVDPDNRVMIVTNLKLAVTELPNNLIAGERLGLEARLREGEQTIARPDFLKLLQVQVEQQAEGQPARQWQLADNGLADDAEAGDGVFSLTLGPTLAAGQHDLLVAVDGKTFQRQYRQTLRVFASPLEVAVGDLDDPRGGYSLLLTQALDWLQPESMKIGAVVQRADGSAAQLSAAPLAGGQWRIDLPGLSRTETYTVGLSVLGRATSGRDFNVKLPPLTLAPPAAEPVADAGAAPEAAEAEAAGVNWLLVVTILVTGNIALFGIVGLVMYLLRQRRSRMPGFGDGAADAVGEATQ